MDRFCRSVLETGIEYLDPAIEFVKGGVHIEMFD